MKDDDSPGYLTLEHERGSELGHRHGGAVFAPDDIVIAVEESLPADRLQEAALARMVGALAAMNRVVKVLPQQPLGQWVDQAETPLLIDDTDVGGAMFESCARELMLA